MASTNQTTTFLMKVHIDYDIALDHFWDFAWSDGGDWTDVVEELHEELFKWKVEFESAINIDEDSQ